MIEQLEENGYKRVQTGGVQTGGDGAYRRAMQASARLDLRHGAVEERELYRGDIDPRSARRAHRQTDELCACGRGQRP